MAKKKTKRKKDSTYICVICSKKQKSDKKIKCCGKFMLTKDKVWPD